MRSASTFRPFRPRDTEFDESPAARPAGTGEPESHPTPAWARALDIAEAQLNRPVMRRLTAVFCCQIALFYGAFGLMLLWNPGS